MTRSHPIWPVLGFLAASLAIGLPYWQLEYRQVSLPSSLYGAGLAVVFVVAALLRGVAGARFWMAWLVAAAAAPAVVMARVMVETGRDPTSHNLWPLEVIIALAIGLAWALAGAAAGSLLLLRRRPA